MSEAITLAWGALVLVSALVFLACMALVVITVWRMR